MLITCKNGFANIFAITQEKLTQDTFTKLDTNLDLTSYDLNWLPCQPAMTSGLTTCYFGGGHLGSAILDFHFS